MNLMTCENCVDVDHNPNHVYSKVGPTVLNGPYSQESVFSIAAIVAYRFKLSQQ